MPSDDIARLYNFTPFTTANADQVDAEFDQLVATMNAKVGRATTETISGAKTFSAQSTFSGGAIFSTTAVSVTATLNVTGPSILTSLTCSSAVTFSQAVVCSSTLSVQEPTLSGHAASKNYVDTNVGAAQFNLMIRGCIPEYTSTSVYTVGAGVWRDATNTQTFTIASPITVNITVSGAGGLDTGSEASATWYYLWLIGKTDGTNSAIWSTSSSAPTMPSGYTLKRRIATRRNNASSDFLEVLVGPGWPYRAEHIYKTTTVYYDSGYGVGTTNVLTNGTATSYTTLTSASNFISPQAVAARIVAGTRSANEFFTVRDSSSGSRIQGIVGASPTEKTIFFDSNQQFEYKRTSGSYGVDIDIRSWVEGVA